MRPRFMILIALTCSVLASVTTTATAGSDQRSALPCNEYLTIRQAAVAMGEPIAFILSREFTGSTLTCIYSGGKKGAKKFGHGLTVNWGPYADVREAFESGEGKRLICAAIRNACRSLKEAAGLRSNLKSFASLGKALAQVGIAKRLQSSAFEGNPALVWKPSQEVAPLDLLAWVFVYVVKFEKLLLIDCTDTTDETADTPCAIAAAKTVYNNITS